MVLTLAGRGALTGAQVTTALGYTPSNRAGDTYTPATNGDAYSLLTIGSTKLAATNQGVRRSVLQFFDTKTDDVDTAIISMDIVQRTNVGNAPLKKTGIHVKHFAQPDNGSDSSGGLFVETGGGSALTAYKINSTHKPTGYEDYTTSAQGAVEAGTSDLSQAVLALAGVFGTTLGSHGIWARIDNAASRGIIVGPNDAVFDTRYAYQVGTKQRPGPDTNLQYTVRLNGEIWTKGLVHAQKTGVGETSEIRAESAATSGVAQVNVLGKTSADVLVSARLSADAGSVTLGSISGHAVLLVYGSAEQARINGGGIVMAAGKNLLASGGAAGGGTGVVGLGNAATLPTTNPAGGGVLYAEAGSLKWRGSAGTITTIALA